MIGRKKTSNDNDIVDCFGCGGTGLTVWGKKPCQSCRSTGKVLRWYSWQQVHEAAELAAISREEMVEQGFDEDGLR